MIKGLSKMDYRKCFDLNPDSRTRGHTLKLKKPGTRKGLNIRQKFFSFRIINTWNLLPQEVVDSTSVLQFKIRLGRHCEDRIQTWVE